MKLKGPTLGTQNKRSVPGEERAEFDAVLSTLKKILKERGLSYRALAKTLGLSESGLKKIFNSKDCSFQRLSQIARALGIRMTDLLDEIERAEIKSVRFTSEQQQFFLKNLDVFHFFMKLVIEREPAAEIQKQFKLSEQQLFRYLKKLDELHLIRLFPGNQIKIPPLAHVRDFGEGPLLEKVYHNWGVALIEDLAHPRFQNSGHFIIRCLKMKDETYKEFLRRLLELEAEFLRRAIREMNISAPNLKPVRWISLTDQQSYIRSL